VNDSELGNLGLSADEEAAVVAFMRTLTDGWTMPAAESSARDGSRLALAVTRSVDTGPSLSFSLAKGSHVRFEVFDVRGRRVALLEDAWLPAGDHRYAPRMDRLASGVYLARLVTRDGIATSKFTLMR
jgi:hypothetical protein